MYRQSIVGAPYVIVAFNTHVIAVERVSGRSAWHFDADDGESWSVVAATVDRVLVAAARRLVCLDYATGSKLWDVITHVPTTGALLVAGEEIVLGVDGRVACYSLGDGHALWYQPFEGMGDGSVSLRVPET